MKPHRGTILLAVLFCASCQVQQYIDNEDLRIYNTPIGKTKLAESARTSAEATPQPACAPASLQTATAAPAPAATSAPAPLPPSVQSGSDWTEESPGDL